MLISIETTVWFVFSTIQTQLMCSIAFRLINNSNTHKCQENCNLFFIIEHPNRSMSCRWECHHTLMMSPDKQPIGKQIMLLFFLSSLGEKNRYQSSWYSRTPLIRPPSESHWCGRIRGMVAREGFRYAALLQQRHTKYGRIRGMVVGEGGRSTGVLLYQDLLILTICTTKKFWLICIIYTVRSITEYIIFTGMYRIDPCYIGPSRIDPWYKGHRTSGKKGWKVSPKAIYHGSIWLKSMKSGPVA